MTQSSASTAPIVTYLGHHPFRSRKVMVLWAIGLALGLGTFPWTRESLFATNPFYVFFLYALIVTTLDVFLTYILKKKPSSDAVAEALQINEKVTPEEFDQYYKTRTKIRVVSLLMAGISFLGAYALDVSPLNSFFYGYLTTTLSGISVFRFKDIKRPKVFHVYPLPPGQRSIHCGGQTAAQNVMNHESQSTSYESRFGPYYGSDFGPYYIGPIRF